MKLPMKPIVMLVMAALGAIFAYQTYWLIGLYGTLEEKIRSDVQEAVRVSDYEEMMHRIKLLRQRDDVQHGQMDVTVDVDTHTHKAQVSTQARTEQTQQAALQTNISDQNLTTMLRDSKNMVQFGLYMQQGIHSALDDMQEVSPAYFDSLLTRRLDSLGLDTTHRTLFLHHYTLLKDKPQYFTDTLADIGTRNAAYTDTVRLELSLSSSTTYEVLLPAYTHTILRQMAGILVASLLTLVVLAAAFWYLIHTLRRLRTIDEMKSDFTHNMTHELKTPIAVAYAANDALLHFDAGRDPDKARRYLEVSRQQLQKLSDLVEQILSMSMERRRTMQLVMEQVDVRPMVEALAAQHRLKADKPVEVNLDMPDDLRLRTDRNHFANIISNLLDNAIKYSETQAHITITARRTAEGVEMRVEDQGIGISKDRLPYIFDKFYRVPHGNLHAVKGYGLGLYYVKTMIRRLGGEVTAESTPGRGTIFKLLFHDENQSTTG